MRFVFNGITFSICFRHDKSRNLGDHWRHDVSVVRCDTKFGVWCNNCDIFVGPVAKRMRDRKTHCVIRAHVNGEWIDVFTGTGNPNEDEGDRFTKEIGRRASLANALDHKKWWGAPVWAAGLEGLQDLRVEFKQVAWAAFNGRKQNGKRSTGTVDNA